MYCIYLPLRKGVWVYPRCFYRSDAVRRDPIEGKGRILIQVTLLDNLVIHA